MHPFKLQPPASAADQKLGRCHQVLLVLCIGLFLVLRLPWLGHLLVWDEAMTLCTVRAFLAGAHDTFSDWFWRHPPLYTLGLLLLRPFQGGFDGRAEFLSVFFGLLSQLALFFLNRRVFGNGVALWSAFLLAVMPGSVFFDTWIKQDHPVSTLGLLAILLLLRRQVLYAGLCLGLALLSKETAVFYVAAVLLLWLGRACGQRSVKDFFALTVLPALTCGWWYLMVLPKIGQMEAGSQTGAQDGFWSGLWHAGAVQHLRFAVGTETGWQNQWFYYFSKLPVELGWAGLALAVGGMLVSIRLATHRNKAADGPGFQPLPLWPLCLLLPALLLLSILPSKVPWVVIVLFPAWATLQAVAMTAILGWLCPSPSSDGTHPAPVAARRMRRAGPAIAAGAILIGILVVRGRDYETILRRVDEGQWRGASYSREAAMKMNELTHDGERALVTSFHYWKGIPPGHPCPIFACYFTRQVDLLIRSHERSFQDLVNDIKTYRLDWALLSPEPGAAEYEVFGGFEQKLGLKPYPLSQAFLFHTTSLYQPTRPPPVP